MNSSENQAIHTLAIRATNAFRFFADNILGTDSNPRIERRFLKPIVEVQNSRLWFNRRKFHSRAHAPPFRQTWQRKPQLSGWARIILTRIKSFLFITQMIA